MRIRIDCADPAYFDTLSLVLLTANNSDLGGEGNFLTESLGPGRRLLKSLPRKEDGFFYVDSVKRDLYRYFIIQSNVEGYKYTGYRINNDYSEVEKDTAETSICLQPSGLLDQH